MKNTKNGLRADEKTTIRTIQERDVDQVVEMHSLVGTPIKTEIVRDWCRENPHSQRLIAEVDGRAVGKVTLDTAYPPYAELVNLMVHPDYRRRGVANHLVQGCLEDARSRGHPITLLMTEPGNTLAITLYTRNGFLTGIPGGEGERDFNWMIHLPKDSIAQRFIDDHPSSGFTLPLYRTPFHGRPLYEMRWNDPYSGSVLGLLLEGQPGQPMEGGTAPRIAGATLTDGAVAGDLLILPEKTTIENDKDAQFQMLTVNNGKEDLTIEEINHIPLKGVAITVENGFPNTLKSGEKVETQFKVSLGHDFETPILSFATVLITLSVKLQGYGTPILMTAGFERG